MAGASSKTDAPYPTGDGSTVNIRIGGHVVNGLTAAVIATWKLPWDCEIVGVDYSYTKITTDLTLITLKTVDSTALTIVATANPGSDIAAVAQTLHADVVGVNIVKGNKIQITVDTQGANEQGMFFADLHLRPTYG
jgi:hypothetical protein